jgi:hypothetical protein
LTQRAARAATAVHDPRRRFPGAALPLFGEDAPVKRIGRIVIPGVDGCPGATSELRPSSSEFHGVPTAFV